MRLVTLAVLTSASLAASQLVNAPRDHQKPLNIPAMPGGGPNDGAIRLSDVMSRDKSINIFAGFVTDIEPVQGRLEDEARNTTVLAPLNSAVEALPRKPWEDPREYGELGSDAYEGDDGQERATRNLKRFVEAHMVPRSPWSAGDKVKPIGDDREVWWEEKDGTRYVCFPPLIRWSGSRKKPLTYLQIQPGDIEVVSVGKTVANGEIVSSSNCPLMRAHSANSSQWIIKKVRNYA